MDCISVCGNLRLDGEINVSGCKNAVLPIIAATLLNKKTNIIHNCPHLSDVYNSIDIIKSLGCEAALNNNTLYVDSKNLTVTKIPSELMSKLRASVLFIPALLVHSGKAEFCMPGGCKIGDRPIDIHLAAFEKMGVEVECREDSIVCRVNDLVGNDIFLPRPSVGATENVMLLATLSKGVTRIYNAAKEPEISDLGNFLNCMGAKVFGIGTDVVTVYGTQKLYDTEYRVMPDRIEAATFACAVATSGGTVKINKALYRDISNCLTVLEKMGVSVVPYSSSILVSSNKRLNCPSLVCTRPYPGFPTDTQSLVMSVMSCSNGIGTIVENIFENRLLHANELNKMGADITVDGNRAFVRGKNLHGAQINACDLRSAAALVVAALSCDDLTRVGNCWYIDRGYENFVHKLKVLGANVERVNV